MNRIPLSFGACVAYGGWAIALAGLALIVGGRFVGYSDAWQLAAVLMSFGIALGVSVVPKLSGYQFTAWIVAAVCMAMVYPDYCLRWGSGESSWDLTHPLVLLAVIQIVMFGMGTRMSLRDFAGVARMPRAVFVGLFCQFTIMPLLGYAIAKSLRFPDEVAAGVILIGSCSSGLASKVMVYLARGNVALSITLTSVATLVSPLVTPLWMRFLANELVESSLTKMMLNTFKIVVVPLVAAFLSDYLLRANATARRCMGGVATACAAGLWGVQSSWWAKAVTRLGDYAGWMDVLAFLMGSVVAGFLFFLVANRRPTIRDKLSTVGLAPIVFSPWMNLSGSLLAKYWRRKVPSDATSA